MTGMSSDHKGHSRRGLLLRGVALGAGALAVGSGIAAVTSSPAGAQARASQRPLDGETQSGWRYCSRCKGMYFGGAGNGVCPAPGPGHDPSLSKNYFLWHDTPPDNVSQAGWRWCRKCQGLAFGAVAGVCPTPGPGHDYSGSFDYSPFTVTFISRQSGWRHCKKFQGMHYAPSIAQSHCPNGGTHTTEGSFEYFMDTVD